MLTGKSVVFQPGSARNSRALATDDLFESGRAVLTPQGQARLDEIARWCKYAGQPTSQIVIAAYTDDVAKPRPAPRSSRRSRRTPFANTWSTSTQFSLPVGSRPAKSPPSVSARTSPSTVDPSSARPPLTPHRDHSVHTADVVVDR